jgi:hypothetical protein
MDPRYNMNGLHQDAPLPIGASFHARAINDLRRAARFPPAGTQQQHQSHRATPNESITIFLGAGMLP